MSQGTDKKILSTEASYRARYNHAIRLYERYNDQVEESKRSYQTMARLAQQPRNRHDAIFYTYHHDQLAIINEQIARRDRVRRYIRQLRRAFKQARTQSQKQTE